MSQAGRGALFLSANASDAVGWVRRGVVPCHVLEHAAWSVVVPAVTSTPVTAPYDDAQTVLASRQVSARMAPSIGLFHIEDVAVVTARGAGRSTTRWALRSSDHAVVAVPELPPLSPDGLHRVLGSGARRREVRVREVRDLWRRADLTQREWLVEVATVLGLPGTRVLDGTDTALGPVVGPAPRTVGAFESVVKDVYQ